MMFKNTGETLINYYILAIAWLVTHPWMTGLQPA